VVDVPLTAAVVALRVHLAGIDPANLSGHSLRSGFITSYVRDGGLFEDHSSQPRVARRHRPQAPAGLKCSASKSHGCALNRDVVDQQLCRDRKDYPNLTISIGTLQGHGTIRRTIGP
jgi:hypothetical protein